MLNIKLEQEVIVVGIGNSARYSTPIYKGVVSKIGRKWFRVEIENNEYFSRDNEFSLESGLSNGKGYSSEWVVYESEQAYKEFKEIPVLRKSIIDKLGVLSYKELQTLLDYLEKQEL